MKYLLITLFAASSLFAANDFYYEFDKKVEIQSNTQNKNSLENSDIQEYTTTDGKIVKFKNEIIVQCKKDAYCEDDFEDLNATNYEKISSNYFLIKLDNSENIFTISQQLYLKDDVKSAHPNFIQNKFKKR